MIMTREKVVVTFEELEIRQMLENKEITVTQDTLNKAKELITLFLEQSNDELENFLDFNREELDKLAIDEFVRRCSHCNDEMVAGFVIDEGLYYYCSEECLKKNMKWEDYLELHDNGEGDSYYTEWEE